VISDPSTLASALSAPLSFHHPCRPNLLHPYRHPLLLNCDSPALTHFPHVNHLPRLNYLPRLNSFPRLNHLPRLNCPPLFLFLVFHYITICHFLFSALSSSCSELSPSSQVSLSFLIFATLPSVMFPLSSLSTSLFSSLS
jgi:hypothetical protein